MSRKNPFLGLGIYSWSQGFSRITQIPGSSGSSGSVDFDGTDDYLSLTDSTEFDVGLSNEPFTAELWAYPRSIDTAVNLTLFGRGGGAAAWNATNGHQYLLFLFNDLLYFQWWNGTSLVSVNTQSGDTLTLNQWSHLAVVYDGTNVKVYRNGLEILSFSSTTFGKPSSSNITRIGTQPASGSTWDGYISNVRIVKGTAVYYLTGYGPDSNPLSGNVFEDLFDGNTSTGYQFRATSSGASFNPITVNSQLRIYTGSNEGELYLNQTIPTGHAPTVFSPGWVDVTSSIPSFPFQLTDLGYHNGSNTSSTVLYAIEVDGALVTQLFTPPTEQLTAVPGTSLLCCQSPTDATEEATGKELFANNGAVASEFNPFN